MTESVSFYKRYKTRFPQLEYGRISKHEWSFFATDTNSRVGAIYRSRAELLADLTRYARENWGLET